MPAPAQKGLSQGKAELLAQVLRRILTSRDNLALKELGRFKEDLIREGILPGQIPERVGEVRHWGLSTVDIQQAVDHLLDKVNQGSRVEVEKRHAGIIRELRAGRPIFFDITRLDGEFAALSGAGTDAERATAAKALCEKAKTLIIAAYPHEYLSITMDIDTAFGTVQASPAELILKRLESVLSWSTRRFNESQNWSPEFGFLFEARSNSQKLNDAQRQVVYEIWTATNHGDKNLTQEQKTRLAQLQRELGWPQWTPERAEEEFKREIEAALGIPADRRGEVVGSEEYKNFMKLCLDLRKRMIEDEKPIGFFARIWQGICNFVYYVGLISDEREIEQEGSSDTWIEHVASKAPPVTPEQENGITQEELDSIGKSFFATL